MITVKTLACIMLSFEALTNKKLQKLCYYAYAWYLTIFGRKIAPIEFEAWVHGPVSRELYAYYRSYGWDDIPMYKGFVMADTDIIAFCKVIWEKYGKYSADKLEEKTHEELPWKKAREGYKVYEPSCELIKDEDIVQYFRTELLNEENQKAFANFIKR